MHLSFIRPWIALVVAMAAWLAGGGPGVGAEEPPCLRPPVTGVVIDPFREPACTWCAGNRGIEYRVAEQTVVRAASSGTVTYIGTVVGTGYVVVELANGWRLTYGHVDDVSLRLGVRVLAGSVIGRASGTFHFGLRVSVGSEDDYADPAPFIGRLVGRARLVPLDGSPERPLRDEHTRCRVGGTAR